MSKEKIAIISVLKPVDDVRSFYKMARSLDKANKYDIHLFGYPSQYELNPSNINFHPHTHFKRIGVIRLLIPCLLLYKLAVLKPKLIIANTHELLLTACLCKALWGCRIIYDIQENYAFNLRHQQNYTACIRWTLAILIRIKERILLPFFNHAILAEKAYFEELSFINSDATIIENKSTIPLRSTNKKNVIRVIYSGTITESNGIITALDLMRAFHKLRPDWEYSIVGHCPQQSIRTFLAQSHFGFIKFNINEQPIPFSVIEQEIGLASLGLITYRINASNKNCMPSKVFDYLASGLPMLYQAQTYWGDWIKSENYGLPSHFSTGDSIGLVHKIENFLSSFDATNIEASRWYHEENKFVTLIENQFCI